MTSRQALQSRLVHGLAALRVPDRAGLVDALLDYLELLVRWNRAYNLTAVRDPQDMVARHLLDSLTIRPWVDGQRVIDVGSGAGLPGIPLALARPEAHFTVLDGNGKKARFLRQVVRELGLKQVSVVESRAEAYRPQDRFDCLTARAFADPARLLVQAGHLLAPGGRVLAMRGRLNDDPTPLPEGFVVVGRVPLTVPGLDAERHLEMIEHET